ncbi:DegV family protein [Mycobacterium parmense]|uniref:DegV domain-containing protein n=1 Tax=Mycobacterium parmense TaxID=185642 RepID=A0A7I7YPK6_9MYCO|nr:DegV family protein [Mycobacterium parmense]MCV7353207.1 DegV family protein [Mycobacterium parmense]ORW62922.1 fatty acid-binding protein DegV [Mycobacterium parmense]BBZ43217.1 DegV domain-containing protein [Mycobacterium parmense]
MSVVVVTDASARLPAELLEQWPIRVVPLHILLDGADLRDGVDEIPDDIYRLHATTAAATPAELACAYRRALDDSTGNGPEGVVAVHISSALSGTCGAAQRTAADLDPRIRVVDSKSTAMGTGFVALAAARAAAGGGDVDAVAQAATAAVRRGHAFVVVHRLDNLRRSGRIGGARAWLGTALALKPLLRIDDGKLVLAQRVRTVSNATAAMIERVCELVGEAPAELAVHHVANPEGAAEVAATLAQRLPACEPAIVTPLGPVLALHVGAGAVAICLQLP